MKKIVGFLSMIVWMFMMPMVTMAQSDVIQVQPTNINGVNAEVIQCKRKKGVLSIKIRFVSQNADKTSIRIDTNHGAYNDFYVMAENKKYFILKDTEGNALAPKYIDTSLAQGENYYWWAKFPAPPAEVKEINIVIPKVLPFEDVAITDQ